ncbi:hypothetical protein GJ496_001423 [Pomphorhynchus laevis]|nr:hypothetical protein GJ496_001423 [Pomphorhynchus laevis]
MKSQHSTDELLLDKAFDYFLSLNIDVNDPGQIDYEDLRNTIEKDIIHTHQSLLDTIAPNISELRKFYKRIEDLKSESQNIMKASDDISNKAKNLRIAAQKIKEEREQLEYSIEKTENFISDYQLDNASLSLLQSPTIKEKSINLFIRINEIMENCNSLYGQKNEVLRNDIIKQMTEYRRTLLENMFKWASDQFHLLESSKSSSTVILQRVLRIIETDPQLGSNIVDEFVSSRSKVFTRGLLSLFTEGDQPLDTVKYDFPLYLTILLNWLHEECIYQQSLLGIYFPDKECNKLLDIVMTNGCEIVKDRFESSLLVAGEDLNLLQCATRLLESFCKDLNRVVRTNTMRISKIFEQLSELAKSLLVNCVHSNALKLVNDVPPTFLGNRRLQPTQSFIRANEIIREACRTASIDCNIFLHLLVDACSMQAHHFPRTESTVLSLNCLESVKLYMQDLLNAEAMERIEAQIAALIESLILDQGNYLMEYLSLKAINDARANKDISKDSVYSSLNLATARIQSFISAKHPVPLLGQCLLIKDVKMINIVMDKSIDSVINTYEDILQWLETYLPKDQRSDSRLVDTDQLRNALTSAALIS